jgi:SAM-dependent methyltransferase
VSSGIRQTGTRWRRFWEAQAEPGHAEETEEHYRLQAAELRILIGDGAPRRILEIGCGNGALFSHLGFDTAKHYVGVDFSPRMLAVFRERIPVVETVLADGASFRYDEEFDLVFSNQVVQYWTPRELPDHVDNALSMLAADGTVVVAGVPSRRMRLAYARGDLTGGRRRTLPGALLTYVDELVRSPMGHWYDYPDFRRVARDRGLDVRFFGSLTYPYRFHAVLWRA